VQPRHLAAETLGKPRLFSGALDPFENKPGLGYLNDLGNAKKAGRRQCLQALGFAAEHVGRNRGALDEMPGVAAVLHSIRA
jgi:hypothetical protein